jgi:hypothetical protein
MVIREMRNRRVKERGKTKKKKTSPMEHTRRITRRALFLLLEALRVRRFDRSWNEFFLAGQMSEDLREIGADGVDLEWNQSPAGTGIRSEKL